MKSMTPSLSESMLHLYDIRVSFFLANLESVLTSFPQVVALSNQRLLNIDPVSFYLIYDDICHNIDTPSLSFLHFCAVYLILMLLLVLVYCILSRNMNNIA